MVQQTEGLSVLLFKVAILIFGLVLGLQLLGTSDVIPFDITEIWSFQQWSFIWILLVVTILAFIEGTTMQARAGGGVQGFTIGVAISFAIAFVGLGLTLFVIFAEDPLAFPPEGYEFNDSEVNQLIGWYLLVGTLLIFINARNQILKARILFQ